MSAEWNRFYFGYVGYDETLEREANQKLQKLVGFAPPGAIGVGWIEKVGQRYYAKAVIRTSFRTFQASTSRNDPRNATHRVLQKLEDEIFRWRFGSGSGSYGHRPPFQIPTLIRSV